MRRLRLKLLRFAIVGVANTAIYGLFTTLYVAGFGLNAKIASGLGYCTAVPLAFVAHRSYTFAAQGLKKVEFARFAVTQLVNLFVSVFAMAATIDFFSLPYWAGIVSVIVLIPLANFFVFDSWVFAQKQR